MTPDPQEHWSRIYREKAPEDVSWYQAEPGVSLALIDAAGLPPNGAVFDVGGGTSRLVDRLLDRGLRVTVLDVSPEALALVRARLGTRAADVRLVAADVTEADVAAGTVDLWHDRAVFHFLVDAARQDAYIERMRRALRPGGHALIATFDLDGPERCSGLPVVRYSPETLHRRLGRDFVPVRTCREAHTTPTGATQHFQYSLFRRGSAAPDSLDSSPGGP